MNEGEETFRRSFLNRIGKNLPPHQMAEWPEPCNYPLPELGFELEPTLEADGRTYIPPSQPESPVNGSQDEGDPIPNSQEEEDLTPAIRQVIQQSNQQLRRTSLDDPEMEYWDEMDDMEDVSDHIRQRDQEGTSPEEEMQGCFWFG